MREPERGVSGAGPEGESFSVYVAKKPLAFERKKPRVSSRTPSTFF